MSKLFQDRFQTELFSAVVVLTLDYPSWIREIDKTVCGCTHSTFVLFLKKDKATVNCRLELKIN